MAGINEIAKAAGVNADQVKAVAAAIVSEAKKGGSAMIKDFGTFKIKAMPEREFPNPQKPGSKIIKPAHNALKFKPSNNLDLE